MAAGFAIQKYKVAEAQEAGRWVSAVEGVAGEAYASWGFRNAGAGFLEGGLRGRDHFGSVRYCHEALL